MIHFYIAGGLAVVALVLAVVGRRQGGNSDLYDLYVEAANTSELAPGVPAFYGGQVTAVEGQPQLVAPYAQQPCVWYESVTEQEEMRTDPAGNQTPEWRTVSSTPAEGVTFAVVGNGGTVLVNPANARVDKPQHYEQFLDAQGGGVANFINAIDIMTGHRVRVRESFIPLGQQLYVGGVGQEQNTQMVFANDQSYPLILTTETKTDMVESGRRASILEYVGAAVFFLAALGVLAFLKV